MKINEIELVSSQQFPIATVQTWLNDSTPHGMLDQFVVNYIERGTLRVIILTDIKNVIAAMASFSVRLNGRVWQARNVAAYDPYKGQQLAGKIYKMVKEIFHTSIQSDTEQSFDGMKLWTKTLPSLGLKPMVFDTKTDRIIDSATFDTGLMYPQCGTPDQWRYTWIIEAYDHYPEQNLLTESDYVMPVSGLWYKSTKKRFDK